MFDGLTVDPESRFTTATYSGTLAAADILDFRRRITAAPGFRPDFDHLADLRAVERVEIESGQLASLAGNSPFGKGSHVALVTLKDVVYGLARVFEMGSGVTAAEINVFRDMGEACAWLGIT